MKLGITSSAIISVFVSLAFFFVSPSASAQGIIYDQEQRFQDPTLEVPVSCEVCVDVYQVRRPIMPAVNHEFVGTQLHTRCNGVDSSSLQIFGAVKFDDLDYLNKYMSEGRTDRMTYIGRACGSKARAAYAEFSRFSREWRAWSRNPWNGIPRFIATPILGRPCAVASNAIADLFVNSYREYDSQSLFSY